MAGAQGAIAKEATGAGRIAGENMSKSMGASIKKAVGPLLAVFGAAALGRWATSQVQALGRIEKINTQTASAIRSTGGAANVTASEVENLAGSIENMTATEAESIQQGANMLLTFKNIRNEAGAGNDIFNQSVLALNDMSVAMGQEPRTAAIQLGKALNDPVAGISALSRVGITFTEDQKNLIKSMVEAGDVASAQKVILAELNSQFGGSAESYANTFAGSIDLMSHAWGTFGEAIFSGAMPALQAMNNIAADVFNFLAEKIASDRYVQWAENFGAAIQRLAGWVEDLLFPSQESQLEDSMTGVAETVKVLQGPMQSLIEFGEELWKILGTAFSELVPQVVELWMAFSPLGLLMDVLMPVLPVIAETLGEIALVLSSGLALVLPIVVDLMTLLAATLSGALLAILPRVADLIAFLAQTLADILPVVLPVVIKGVQMLAAFLSGALAVVLPIIVTLVEALVGALMELLPALLPIVEALVNALLPVVGALLPPLLELIKAILPVLVDLLMALLPVVIGVIQVIAAILVPVINILGKVLEWAIGIIVSLITWLAKAMGSGSKFGETIKKVWEVIQLSFRIAWDFILNRVIRPFMDWLGNLRDSFNNFRERVGVIWGALKEVLAGPFRWIRDNVINPFMKFIREDIPKAFETAKDAISTAWDKVKRIAATPVNFVIGTVYNDGIRAVFNKLADAVGLSLRLPKANLIQLAEGTEDHRAQIAPAGAMRLWAEQETGGEAYIPLAESKRSRSTDILGTVAKRFGYQLMPFAEGGFWNNVGGFFGGVGDWFKDTVGDIAAFLSNPAEGLLRLLTRPMESLLSTVTRSPLGQALVELPRAVVEGLIEKAVGLLTGPADSSGPWTRPMRGGRVTSRYGPRWGGFHAGIDLAGGGRTFAARAGRVAATGWNILAGHTGIGILLDHGNGLQTYYGHNPPGGVQVNTGQFVKAGQHIGFEGATGNVTGVHVHFGLREGGRMVNPEKLGIFDNGGWLMPGHAAVNMSSRPEPVLSADQWDSLGNGLGRDDLDYLADRIIDGLSELARGAGTANDLARNARLRTRMAGAR